MNINLAAVHTVASCIVRAACHLGHPAADIVRAVMANRGILLDGVDAVAVDNAVAVDDVIAVDNAIAVAVDAIAPQVATPIRNLPLF
jgi:hypothetical protein